MLAAAAIAFVLACCMAAIVAVAVAGAGPPLAVYRHAALAGPDGVAMPEGVGGLELGRAASLTAGLAAAWADIAAVVPAADATVTTHGKLLGRALVLAALAPLLGGPAETIFARAYACLAFQTFDPMLQTAAEHSPAAVADYLAALYELHSGSVPSPLESPFAAVAAAGLAAQLSD